MNARNNARTQHAPIFVVKANGTTVEFTDDRQEAHAAFACSNATLREMFKVEENGSAKRIKYMVNGREYA
jgi:hypothetical protein